MLHSKLCTNIDLCFTSLGVSDDSVVANEILSVYAINTPRKSIKVETDPTSRPTNPSFYSLPFLVPVY